MRPFLQLTRPLNLAIIAFTMVAMRYGVIDAYLRLGAPAMADPALGSTLTHGFSTLHFWLLVLSTVSIAAGGNIINDYFDTRIDRVNRPHAVIVGRTVKRRVAIMGHWVLTGLGIVLGIFVAWRSHALHLAVIPVFAAGSLWLYSTRLKRSFLLGNGLVATLVALVPLSVGLYEIPALAQNYGSSVLLQGSNDQLMDALLSYKELWAWVLGYSFFAFLTTLVRELQKDMADIKGDEADGCRTVPIVWGVKWAKVLVLFYLALAIVCLLLVRDKFLTDRISHWYIDLGIIGPLLLSAGFTYHVSTRQGFHVAGNILKAGMAIAITFAFFVGYTL